MIVIASPLSVAPDRPISEQLKYQSQIDPLVAQSLFAANSLFSLSVLVVISMFSRSQSFGVLRNAMGAYALRLKVLANNIANVDTPGFERSSVKFEENLQRARRSLIRKEPLEEIQASVQDEKVKPTLEDELLQLTETQMRNHVASRSLHDHFSVMRTAVTGRTA